MNEFMSFYWDWGIFISGIIVLFVGVLVGAALANEKHKKMARKDIEKTLIPVSSQGESSHQ